jgi:hypothetical protein
MPEWPVKTTLAPVQQSPYAVGSSSSKAALGKALFMVARDFVAELRSR